MRVELWGSRVSQRWFAGFVVVLLSIAVGASRSADAASTTTAAANRIADHGLGAGRLRQANARPVGVRTEGADRIGWRDRHEGVAPWCAETDHRASSTRVRRGHVDRRS